VERLTDRRRKKVVLGLGNDDRTPMRVKHTDSLLKHGGQALSEFLQQIKKHNADVVSSSDEDKVVPWVAKRRRSARETQVPFPLAESD
jgi:hypothetical protein